MLPNLRFLRHLLASFRRAIPEDAGSPRTQDYFRRRVLRSARFCQRDPFGLDWQARWGRSSVGRASRSQCEGRGFESLRLQSPLATNYFAVSENSHAIAASDAKPGILPDTGHRRAGTQTPGDLKQILAGKAGCGKRSQDAPGAPSHVSNDNYWHLLAGLSPKADERRCSRWPPCKPVENTIFTALVVSSGGGRASSSYCICDRAR